jgi:HSP20 family molecular chaperone IbpA
MRQRDPRFWVWAESLALLQGAERLPFRFSALAGPQSLPCWEPSVDMYEERDELLLLVALPGVSAPNLEVVCEGSRLIVRGNRPIPQTFYRATIHRLEIPYGKFERRIALPAGDFLLREQFFEDGCLILVLHRI